MTLLIVSNFILLGAAMYLWGRNQLLSKDNARLLIDNAALLNKALNKHGFTDLHETPEVVKSRQGQVIDMRPPIHAAIQAEEEAEERQYMLSEAKKEELREEARLRA